MQSNFIRWGLTLTALLCCSMADAHPGHMDNALAGIVHPFLGVDHLLAMVAVGVWASQLGGRARWLLPASFVAIMGLSGGIGMAGFSVPMVESGIATSVLLLGLLIAFSVKMQPALGAGLIGLFAVFHGYAHGAEMPGLSAPWQYGFGFMLATATLHGLGLLLGGILHQRSQSLRVVGTLLIASGVWMVATTI
jgi:urease accessory protein